LKAAGASSQWLEFPMHARGFMLSWIVFLALALVPADGAAAPNTCTEIEKEFQNNPDPPKDLIIKHLRCKYPPSPSSIGASGGIPRLAPTAPIGKDASPLFKPTPQFDQPFRGSIGK
jgi:hypothetical protein